MTDSLVSIIMPAYGVERYIARAIESVQSQSHPSWELIIVNDGTTDRSRDIAAKYAAKDSRIKIVDKENGGLSDARNAGLKYVQGRYVNFMDSDDWIEPDFIEKLVSKLESADYDVAVCGYYVDIVDDSGNLRSQNARETIPYPPQSKAGYFYLMERFLNFAWNKLYKREFLESHNLLFEKGLWLIEDCEFFSRVLACSPKIGFIDYAGYHYVQRIEETLSKKFNPEVIGFIRRKMDLYAPVLCGIDAPAPVIDEIIEDMRVYSSVYLTKQMAGNLPYEQFRNQAGVLYEDDLLNPDKIKLGRCKNKGEFVILLFSKLRLFRLIHHICRK